MAVEQLEPAHKNGWSKWSIWPRKFKHICCDCLMTHDVEVKIDARKNCYMRWRRNEKFSYDYRRKWGKLKRQLWQTFFT